MMRRPLLSVAAAVAVALPAGLAGCGGGGGDAPAGPPASPPAAAGAPADPTCAGGTAAGRHYVLCTAGDQTDEGLVVALHGRGSSAADMRATTALERPAAAAGLAVAYVDGMGGGWGDDTFTSPDRPRGDEDVVALDGVVAALRADPRIGDGPVDLVGFSNGASMALRYAVDRPAEVAAVAAVAGQLPRDPAVRPAARVPLLVVYGTADPVRPYATGIPDPGPGARAPGQPTPTLPTPDTVAAFVAVAPTARHDGPVTSDTDPADGTSLATERWRDDAGVVAVLVSVDGGGHTWPSALVPPPPTYGVVSHELDASAVAVAFLTTGDVPG